MGDTKRRLMQWATGQAAGTLPDRVATIVLENPGHLAAVVESGLAGPETVIFVPGAAGDAGGPTVVGYDGSLSEAGAEMSISEAFFLQTQDYGTSEYMSVIGPTAVRIFGEEDFELYLSDADRAADEGVFAAFLTHPTVRIADLPGLGAGPGPDGPRLRLHARADGALSTSPAGLPLGKVGDDLPRLRAEWDRINAAGEHPCAVCLGEAVPEERRAAELAARPWLGRYLTALAGLQDLHARGAADVRVSGFGGRLVPGLEGVAGPADLADPDLPLLLWTEHAAYVHQPLHRLGPARTFEVEHRAGRLAEALLVCGSVEAAAEHDDPAGLTTVAGFFSKAGVRLT
ncbi:daptide biosynthesis RiPP recognition protein [Nonomuraea sp. NPDC050153]|uniref:daptide biosynthesis RiPP recognition protein n=1 Tax=Nonomuraea sp. NPDC050153 TaxID=3364359 RepID=UPI0037A9F8F5